ncbi:MAG: hypothetical protein KC432_09730, partial [Thermomicrobiales bacterium]|nr:hypothetical protein [Thermomicrobiales bacterium]
LKTTYYLRSRGATQNEKSTIDVNRRGVQPRWMRARSASAEISITREAAPAAPAAATPIPLTPHMLNGNGHDSSGDEFICEACQ